MPLSSPDSSAQPGRAPHARPARRPGGDQPLAVAGKHVYMIGIGGCGMSGLCRPPPRARPESAVQTPTLRVHRCPHRRGRPTSASTSRTSGSPTIPTSSSSPPPSSPTTPAPRGRTPRRPPHLRRAPDDPLIGTTGVAIAGTHGKSTTTAMLGCALAHAGLDPTVIVGASAPSSDPPEFPPRLAPSPPAPCRDAPGLLLAEALRVQPLLPQLPPALAVITAVEADHLDILRNPRRRRRGVLQTVRPAPPSAENAAASPPFHR